MSTNAKVCMRCGTDCSGKPRTKDAQGRYTCKACFDAATKAPAKAAPKPVAVAPEADDDAALMASLLESAPAGLTEMCPSCGSGMAGGSVVCTICGYNKQTGKSASVKVDKVRSERGAAVAGAAAAVGGAVANSEMTGLILGTVGGLIGGAVGAGIWAALAYSTDREFGIVAWAIGGLVGVLTASMARSAAGGLTGGIAAAIALISIIAGKYLVVSYITDKVEQKISHHITIDAETATAYMARDVAKEHEASGKRYQWPGEATAETAGEEADFPKPIWDDAKSRYEAMSASQKADYGRQVEASLKSDLHSAMSEFKQSDGLAAMFSPLDIIFFLLAVATAFKLGSGMS